MSTIENNRRCYQILLEKHAPQGHSRILTASYLDTPLGTMIAIANEANLYLLEFIERQNLEGSIERLRKKTKSAILPGSTPALLSIQNEIHDYFKGTLTNFKTPVSFWGTPFQIQVWEALKQIPYGETRSYSEVSQSIKKPSAFRALANANGANQLAIIVPCHRVIHNNGNLGGYAGGFSRKQWLIGHEVSITQSPQNTP
ncbi:MAG: methylated-DNA--[protein]-cysteine S-methyltransferase [Legionellaceae bacterium]|nr:methylated-DNA--[protein]-cysteine S-methyltransferase [Legionellaceae bacterium]